MENTKEAPPAMLAGVDFKFHLGQLVAMRSGHCGHIRAISFDKETGRPSAEICLLSPIIIPAHGKYPEDHLYWQYVALEDLRPADEASEITRLLVEALKAAGDYLNSPEQRDRDGCFAIRRNVDSVLAVVGGR